MPESGKDFTCRGKGRKPELARIKLTEVELFDKLTAKVSQESVVCAY